MGCTQSTPVVAESDNRPPVATTSTAGTTTLAKQPQQSPPPSPAAVITNGSATASSESEKETNTNNQNNTVVQQQEQPSNRHTRSNSDSSNASSKSSTSSNNRRGLVPATTAVTNPKTLAKSTSAIGLDEILDDRREVGDLRQNIVHIEVPFGKPIEEVYEGVHNGPVLGSGISGLVRLATHKATGIKYAVKVLDLGLVESPEQLGQLREEILILSQLDHPNIVRLEEVYESHSEIYLVQELCLGGELFDRLDEQPDYHYTEGECARLVKQMLAAVSYCHSRGIIHRDLKLENFLFSSTATDSELKMIDFGLSKHFRYGEVQNEAVGTPYTVAPEVIRGCYDERCDIWAIGVISFLLLSGDPPFGGCGGPESLMTVRSNILKGKFSFEPADIWANVSETAKQFIQSILVIDPKQRPTARQAQKHNWLQEWASRARRHETDHVLNPNVVKALVGFKEYSDMRKLLCEVLSFTLLPDQIKDLRKEFEKMDTDGSGEISLTALKQVLMTNAGAGSLGALTEEEVEDIFHAMRVSKSETRIHWHEFIAAGLSQCQVDDRNLRLAFDRLDSDHKGYITLDDIMDLMGNDTLQSEESMRRMWGDSIRAVKCQHARITYADFLLLMKGQTRGGEHLPHPPPSATLERDLEATVVTGPGGGSGVFGMLHVVPEGEYVSPQKVKNDNNKDLQQQLTPEPSSPVPLLPFSTTTNNNTTFLQPRSSSPLPLKSHSAPSTPADRQLLIDINDQSPSSSFLMSNNYHTPYALPSGPGVPGTSASLTPPQTPERGARDYCTPMGADRFLISVNSAGTATSDSIFVPGLPPHLTPDSSYTRRQARSPGAAAAGEINNTQFSPLAGPNDLISVANAVRDMTIPETGQFQKPNLNTMMKDGSRSTLQVNRHLYRAHRQMRLAVLEASKRFEESQQAHARGLILASQQVEAADPTIGSGAMGGIGSSTGSANSSGGMIQAGLVMRHGHSKQVSSEAIRSLLDENQKSQQALVEKYNRRGGRGKRSRKKTISDMSGMLSKGQEEMTAIAKAAAAAGADEGDSVVTTKFRGSSLQDSVDGGFGLSSSVGSAQSARGFSSGSTQSTRGFSSLPSPQEGIPMGQAPLLPLLPPPSSTLLPPTATADELATDVGELRGATVPGEFRKTADPFGKEGKYGAAVTAFGNIVVPSTNHSTK